MQQHLFEHFASGGHCSFLEDVTIIFIYKTDPKNPYIIGGIHLRQWYL